MNRTRLKFIGSIALMLSTVGVLLAAGGQLNFLGNARPEVEATPVKTEKKTSINSPKYSFYDELKKRKTEVDNARRQNNSSSSNDNQQQSNHSDNNYRYVVQVGAFNAQADADKIKQKVEGLGYPARVVKGGSKYLAQAGPFVGKKKAYSVEKRLKNQKFPTLVKRL